MKVNRRSLPLGTIVHNRYRVDQVLGEGGFGVTYRVTDLKEGRTAAMKEYMPTDIAIRKYNGVEVIPRQDCQEAYERFRDKFLEEAKIIYRYRGHPNIICVHHLFYGNNTAYYVMEFIDGMDLGKMLAQNGQRMRWEELRPIMDQVVSALKEVHDSGMIHCDISPDNIYVLKGGQVKLIDFGAAKSILQGKSSIMMLKRGFAPPEQLSSSGKLGPWTDVYALAVTIYRSITGIMPQSAEDRLMMDKTLWCSQLGIPCPHEGWEPALKKAMSLRIEDRYQSVAEFWTNLNGAPPRQAPQQTYSAGFNDPVLVCINGYFAGKCLPIREEILVGRDPSRCAVVFPPKTPGVSGVHMRLWATNGILMAMDMGSRNGTWLDGQRMTPGLVYTVRPGSALHLGDGQVFRYMPRK